MAVRALRGLSWKQGGGQVLPLPPSPTFGSLRSNLHSGHQSLTSNSSSYQPSLPLAERLLCARSASSINPYNYPSLAITLVSPGYGFRKWPVEAK